MNGIKLKVCGMRDPGNIRDVARVGPDFMGFIFYRDTPRFVGDDFELPEPLPGHMQRVGVFVNERTEVIMDKVRTFQLNFVQLHGHESPAQCFQLKESGVGVIKVFSVGDQMDFGVTRDYADAVDYFLFDTKGERYGGNARRFNWNVLNDYDQRVPFFLSGGIGSEHIDEISNLGHLNIAAIDVNSGVELKPGFKDVTKISAIRAMLNNKRIDK